MLYKYVKPKCNVFEGIFTFILVSFLYFGSVFNYTIIPLVLVGFPSCLKPLYQSEAWCTTIHMKMSLIYM